MLNPKKDENMIDTAAGSCGFPVHTIFHVWKSILAEKNIPQSHLFTLEKKPLEFEDYVQKHVFAIDFDMKAVRFQEENKDLIDDKQRKLAKEFHVAPIDLIGHVLEFRIDWNPTDL